MDPTEQLKYERANIAWWHDYYQELKKKKKNLWKAVFAKARVKDSSKRLLRELAISTVWTRNQKIKFETKIKTWALIRGHLQAVNKKYLNHECHQQQNNDALSLN